MASSFQVTRCCEWRCARSSIVEPLPAQIARILVDPFSKPRECSTLPRLEERDEGAAPVTIRRRGALLEIGRRSPPKPRAPRGSTARNRYDDVPCGGMVTPGPMRARRCRAKLFHRISLTTARRAFLVRTPDREGQSTVCLPNAEGQTALQVIAVTPGRQSLKWRHVPKIDGRFGNSCARLEKRCPDE